MNDPIDELDLLAYADGRLYGERAAQVEVHLQERPELARRLADFARQDRELHAQFDRYTDAPLPDRLAALFEEPPTGAARTRSRKPARQAAAAALMMAMTGGGGWWIGQSSEADADGARAFVQAAVERYVAAGPPAASEVAGAQRMASGEPTLQRFSSRISLELRAPDLSGQGYRLVDKRRVTLDGGAPGLALRYAGAGGDEVQVFLKSRFRDGEQNVRTARQGDVAVTYWNDGPIAVAVASTRGDGAALDALATQVQNAFGRGSDVDPAPRDGIPKLTPYGAPQQTTQEAGAPSATTAPSTGVMETGQ